MNISDFQNFLRYALLFSEIVAAVVGILSFKKFKNSYWKSFIYYLVLIAISEILCQYVLCNFTTFRTYYYSFFLIPIEFLFLYWLYSYKSLNNKKLFWISCSIYLISLLPYFIFKGKSVVNSFNYIIGTFLLTVMIVLEFNKQIKTDDILLFKKNLMFYVNFGVGFFYVGTLPFFAFHSLLWKDLVIWNNYYIIFMITNILMYILFSIALLWGKPNTY